MAKRCLIFYILFCLIITSFLVTPNNTLIFAEVCKDYNCLEYVFYSKEKASFYNCKIVDVGFGSIITCNENNAQNIKRQINDLSGESCLIKIENKDEILNIINKMSAKIISQNEIDGLHIIEAYSSKLSKFVYVSENKVNLQFAFKDNLLTIGYPVIMGSY